MKIMEVKLENPDVVLEFTLTSDLTSEKAIMSYKVYNREPDNYPSTEFLEILAIIFSDQGKNDSEGL